jgi:O-succinylbenzoate synthase
MDATRASKIILKYLINDFPNNLALPNEEYLQLRLDQLDRTRVNYRGQSVNKDIQPRHRARARDMEQNCAGMIAGIKFAISFWHFKEQDLIKVEGLEGLKEAVKAVADNEIPAEKQ